MAEKYGKRSVEQVDQLPDRFVKALRDRENLTAEEEAECTAEIERIKRLIRTRKEALK